MNEVAKLNKSQFKAIVAKSVNPSLQIICEDDVIYEQASVDGQVFRHQLAKLKKATEREIQSVVDKEKQLASPIKLRSENVNVVAVVYMSGTIIYYHIEKAQGKSDVEHFAIAQSKKTSGIGNPKA